MSLLGSVRSVVDNARSFGVGAAFRDLEYRALNKIVPLRIYKGMTAVMEDVDRTLFDTGGFPTRIASAEELYGACADPEWKKELSRDFVDRALQKGDECVGIFDGGKLVSMGWYARTPTRATDTQTLHFDPAWAYMYKGFTLKSHRGKRLHGVGMTYGLKHAVDRGARGLISFVEFNNLQSLRSVEKMGYRLFGDIYVANVNGREVSWATPGCKPYHFYFSRHP